MAVVNGIFLVIGTRVYNNVRMIKTTKLPEIESSSESEILSDSLTLPNLADQLHSLHLQQNPRGSCNAVQVL
jgi:hypothetical protein